MNIHKKSLVMQYGYFLRFLLKLRVVGWIWMYAICIRHGALRTCCSYMPVSTVCITGFDGVIDCRNFLIMCTSILKRKWHKVVLYLLKPSKDEISILPSKHLPIVLMLKKVRSETEYSVNGWKITVRHVIHRWTTTVFLLKIMTCATKNPRTKIVYTC